MMNTDFEILQAIDAGEAQDWEFKSAKGGVPGSLYETYSAMANSRGGVIVLGVEEREGRFYIEKGLEKAAKARQDIWNTLNNRGKISINLLIDSDISLRELLGKTLLVMRIPKAGRRQRPVYVGQNPLDGTYRRNNEGDYHCSRDEVGRMLADQAEETPDMRIMEGYGWDDLDEDSINQYRNRFASVRPTHDWLSRDNKTLLEKLQGWRRDRNSGVEGPTVAGLLMFGKWESIREPDAVPQFHVDYREILTDDPLVRWTDRLVPDGTWSANLFQFYQRTITRATRDLKQPFQLHDLTRIDDSPLHQAIREALTNAVIHADYRGKGGIVIIRRRHGFEMSNPGSLLISFEQMQQGGVSECRNRAIQFMFQMMGSGDKGGTGIDTILKGWSGEHWQSPTIQETVNPDRVILRLPMVSLFPDESIARLRARFGDRFNSLSHLAMQALVAADIEGEVSNSRLQLMSASHPVELTKTLQRLVVSDFLIPRGRGRGTTYYLGQVANAVSEAPNVRSDASNAVSEAANAVSEAPHVRSDTSNAVSSIPQSDQNVGSDLQQMAPSLGSAEFQRLRQQAYPDGIRRKMGNLEMKQAILRICEGRFLTAVQIAQILGREVDALRERFLSPMLREGTLEALYPNSPRHTQQAYRAATLFDNSSQNSAENP